MQMLYRLSYVGLDTWTIGHKRESGVSEATQQDDPIPEEPLRVRVQKDALPRAGFSFEKAVGE